MPSCGEAALERRQERQMHVGARPPAPTLAQGRRAFGSGRALAPGRGEARVDRRQRGGGIALQADRGGSLPVQLIGVDVDAHERTGEVGSRRARRVEVVGLTELGADGEHDVGLREGRVDGAQRERRADAQGVAVGQGALGVDRHADRRAEPLGHGCGLGPRRHGAPAEQQHRALRRREQRDCAFQQRGIRERRGSARGEPLPGAAGQVEHVDRNADVHRSRPARLEDLEGPREGLGELGRVAHLDRLAGDRGHERALVGQVVQRAVPAAVVGASGGAGDDQQRNRVVVGARDRGRGVGQPGARDERADTGLARDARVPVGHERGALLVARRDVANGGVGEAPVDLERVHARNAEDQVDVVLLEQADDRFPAARCGEARARGRLGSKGRGFGHPESV